MPDLIKLLIRHAMIGFALAALLVASLLYFNVGNITELIATSEQGLIALLMLTGFLGLTFASAQMGIAVMLSGRDDGDADDHPGSMVVAVGAKVFEFVRNRHRQPYRHAGDSLHR